jgi:hypothetical protein
MISIFRSTVHSICQQQTPSSVRCTQVAHFSKYLSKEGAKRKPLNTKKMGKGYKKGYGARMEGRISSKGTFITMPEKQTELIVPDLTGFPLKPYVAHNVKRNIREMNPPISS